MREMKEIPDYGDKFTIGEWIDQVISGLFTYNAKDCPEWA